MAKLFLSYSRKDSARAQRFCEWLEREGHEVWRDEDDIGGGASFSAEIEKALNDCDAVIVLWSASSAQSAWVRDEAGFGRDAGKLIPLTLDGTGPPLGFRQFQSLDLSKWKGHGAPPVADRITGAIARVAGAAPPVIPKAAARPKARLYPAVAGIAALLAVIALGLFFWRTYGGDRAITIAVMASPSSPDRSTAADYANVTAADMAAFLPKHFDQATVVAPAEATGQASGYRMLISTDPHGAAANASLTLTGEDGRTTLWSNNWSVPDAAAADLRSEVSESASKAAFCLMQAKGGRNRLSQPALGLYLTGCTGVGATKLSNADFESMFERITKLAPDFGPAWDYLALSRSWMAADLQDRSPAAHAAAVQSARAAIAVARKLNPGSAMSYDAEYHLIYRDHFRGLQVLEKAAKIDPGDGRIQMHLSDEYMAVGRVSDAVQAAQMGVVLEPTTPYTRSQYIQTLFYAGESSKAKADLAAARKRWPDDPTIDSAEFEYQYRYGDPRVALALLPKFTDLSDARMAPYRKVIAARLDPTPGNIDEAIEALNAGWANDQRNRNPVLIALGNFGRVEEAYKLLFDPAFQPFVEKDVLFRPEFAAIRADPRFMALAARLGLVRYWRQTGFWPDFCANEKLKYDCKAEAAKFGS